MVDKLSVAFRHVKNVVVYNGNVTRANVMAFGTVFEMPLARNEAEKFNVFVPVGNDAIARGLVRVKNKRHQRIGHYVSFVYVLRC